MLIDEIAQFLEVNSIGVYSSDTGRNLFIVNLPDADTIEDNAVCLYETTGTAPSIDTPISHPSFQVYIRNKDYVAGSDLTQVIRNLLDKRYNNRFVVNGIYVYTCNLVAQGGHIGKDEKGRDLFSLNFNCTIRDNDN